MDCASCGLIKPERYIDSDGEVVCEACLRHEYAEVVENDELDGGYFYEWLGWHGIRKLRSES